MTKPLNVKIYYEDTDAGGVVYYANYLKYMERARTEYLSDHGVSVAEFHNRGCMFAVVDVEIHYKRPARLGETIQVMTEIVNVTPVTMSIKHHITRDNILLVEADVRIACLDPTGKPRRIPEEMKITAG
ncbi:MAG TPA: YbgC/FadM family acyl-CoA thioesterase [Thermodesulfovibrionales bacterium]|nr:YbgC/FadM family acyl-CoA thioesterase [Thermodesulfovibrionales bacterium]